jgi:exonuclease VII large subunit
MSWMPEPDPTPLRLRLGPRSEVPLPPAFEDADSFEATEDIDAPNEVSAVVETPTAAVSEVAVTPVQSNDPLRAAASEELQRAVEQTAERVERWMADQRRRLSLGIDAMVASLKEQREAELARIEEWKIGERERAERQLAGEKERFHAQLMEELVEFEHQLGERLREQEERLAKWWDEAEQLTKQRFADLGFSPSSEANDSPKA